MRLIEFDLLGGPIGEFLVFAGQVILGLVIFAIELYLAKLASDAVVATKIDRASLLAMAACIGIIVLASAIGLRQIGLANEIITVAFALLFGTIAVAAAVAFDNGGREIAAGLITEWLDKAKSLWVVQIGQRRRLGPRRAARVSGRRRDGGIGEIDPGFARLHRGKRDSHVDPPTSPNTIMRRTQPHLRREQ